MTGDRISHRPSAIPNGPLTESGRAGLSFNPSASLPARGRIGCR
jgi:hypothetical protein